MNREQEMRLELLKHVVEQFHETYSYRDREDEKIPPKTPEELISITIKFWEFVTDDGSRVTKKTCPKT